MKKLLFVMSTGFVCFCISCTNTANNTQGQKNIETVHAIHDVIESGDVSKADQYIAADAVDHTAEGGEARGLDKIKAEFQKLHSDYKDLKFEETQDAANDDYVFSQNRFKGVATTNTMGSAPGTQFDMPFVEVVKFNKDGKATDHWEYITMEDAMKMMGGQNKMENMGNKMDTASKMNKMEKK